MVNRCIYYVYAAEQPMCCSIFLIPMTTERLMNRFHDPDIFYQQLAVLFTLPGSPCIFLWYGDRHGGRLRSGLPQMYALGGDQYRGESGEDPPDEEADTDETDGRGVQKPAFSFPGSLRGQQVRGVY